MVLIYFLPCVMNRFNLMVGSRKGSSVGREMENNTKVFGSEISFFCHSCTALLGCLSQMFRKSEIVTGTILNTGCYWEVVGLRRSP